MNDISIILASVSITLCVGLVVRVWLNYNKQVAEVNRKHNERLALLKKLDARTKNACEYSTHALELLAEGKRNEADMIALYAMEEIVKGENIIEELNKIK